MVPCALLALGSMGTVDTLRAQTRGDAPIAPSSVVGPVTGTPTLAVMGLATLPDGSGNAISQRNTLWMGATQPLGHLGNVNLTAIGSGNWLAKDAVGATSAVDGFVSLRARARVGDGQVWSAVSYGRADVSGGLNGRLLAGAPGIVAGGFDGARADTTISRRIDVGNIGRFESGMIRNVAGVEFSVGFSVERASRVTTQTVRIDASTGLPPATGMSEQSVSTRVLRAYQRRDIATSSASAGFNTGATTWLVSVTAPLATWITSDALSSKPRTAPTVASLAVVQPLNAWLSLVGAASTNTASANTNALRDDVGEGRGRNFAPVLAFGLRIARSPFGRRGDDAPSGILSFESRTIGAVDSAHVDLGHSGHDEDTLRVVLLIDAPHAESVELMGDGTAWTVTQMTRVKSGRWRAELKLSSGVHRVTVRADRGIWIAPPGLPIGNDDFGAPVGMIIIKGNRSAIPNRE